MAGLGFKDFQVGEVLTSSDVDGYLMQQTVMRFADSGARGSALGTAPGTAVALAEGMVTYLDDTNTVEVFTGSVWRGIGGFDSVTTITATDASWTVPTLADPVVRVTVVGGGGGGGEGRGGAGNGNDGSAGGSSSFACSAGTATSAGGYAGEGSNTGSAGGGVLTDGVDYVGNGGEGGFPSSSTSTQISGKAGGPAVKTVAYFDLTGVTTANVSIGAGGTGGSGAGDGGDGRDGADGFVLVEYRAG